MFIRKPPIIGHKYDKRFNKGAFRQGDYYQAVITSANRLRRNDDHKKSVETLRQAYPLGITFYENQVAGAGGAFKWRSIYQSYTYLQTMYTEIQTSPGALKVISNPKNYSAKLEEARQNAAEESYSAGVIALGMGTRDKAKEAHVLFKQVNEYVNGYKDVNQKIDEALWAATVKVLVEPIPAVARVYDVNAEYFDNQLAQQLRAANVNEYVAFLTPSEITTRNIKPDHIVRLGFDEFSIGQTYLKETQIPMERDSLSKEAKPANQASLSNENVKLRPIGNPTTSPLPVKTQPSTPAPNPQPATQPSGPTPTNPQPVVQPQPSTPTPSNPQPATQPQPTNPTRTNPQPATQPQPEPKVEPSVQTPQPAQPATPSVPAVTDPRPSQPVTETKPADNDSKKSDEDKVVICHVPPGNSGNRKAMTIPRSALQGHLNHGDYVGECKDESNAVAEEKSAAQDKDAKEKAEEEEEKLEKEKVEKEKLEKEKADKEKVEKEKLEKEKADKEKSEKEKLEKEKADKEKAEKDKAEKEKKKDNKKDNNEFALLSKAHGTLLASNSDEWWRYLVVDTTGTAITYKATVKHFEKTITSNGTLDLKIIDSQNSTVLLQQKMPSEYVWKSEWVTYNGQEEALTAEQKKLSSQREQQPPSKEELFKQFTDPLLNQLITRLKEFYNNY